MEGDGVFVDPADVDDEPLAADPEIETDCVTKLGLSAVNIANICRGMFFKTIGVEMPENNDALARWTEAVESVFGICEQEIETNWRDLSKSFQHLATGETVPNTQPEQLRLPWEAATRLCVNLITAEDQEEITEARAYDWREWILKKLGGPNDGDSDSDEE